MILLDRISKVYEIVHLWWKRHNSNVFRLRIVSSNCTSSDEKITEEERMTNVDNSVEDEREVTDLTPR